MEDSRNPDYVEKFYLDSGFATRALHAGEHVAQLTTRPHAGAIYQTSTFVFASAEEGAAIFAGETPGYVYTRIGNPTVKVLEAKINAVVSAYNSTIQSIHTASGYGTNAASNSLLAGDSSLRSITSNLSSIIDTPATSGTFQMLSQLGLSRNEDGTLKLDSTKLSTALTKDSTAVATLISNQMASLKSAITDMSTGPTSTLGGEEDTLTQQASKIDDWCTNEQTRLDNYATSLRTGFAAMETAMSQNQALISQLSKLGSS